MLAIKKSSLLSLQLIVTGTHLSRSNGYTVSEIQDDLFEINTKIDLKIVGDLPINIADSTALALSGMTRAFDELKPDLLIILGDRYEILAAAVSALYSGMPIAHIHGGELTEGAIDDAMRHSITKMSHLHFVANQNYKNRVIQLGECPDRVHVVGGFGADAINRLNLLSKQELEKSLGFNLLKKNYLVTYHPETISYSTKNQDFETLLNALKVLDDGEARIIFTMPNTDMGSIDYESMIIEFLKNYPNSRFIKSMGQLNYLSAISYCDCVIGNSSSGILEAPIFKVPTINVGARQNGRLMATSVITCDAKLNEILKAIDTIETADFQKMLDKTISPYSFPNTVEKVISILENVNIDKIKRKNFYDIECES
jgi:GDP/UDP-N,N'-diacetylbacillosamine 2-epimerase (hydrolysing)